MALKELLRLVRFSNLLIVFFTQLLIWFCVVRPLQLLTEDTLFLDLPNVLLLISSTVLIAAGGYIINDYFDVKIDAINRPQKSLIGKDINPKLAIVLHSFCNVLGIIFSAYIAYKFNIFWAVGIQLLTTILLWLYSTHFKRQFVIGNLVVALLTAMSVMVLFAFEPTLYPYLTKNYFINLPNAQIVNPVWVLIIYAFFAFMLTWMREIVKDMEDFKGDAEDGCRTMPIEIGLKKTTNFVIVLGSITLLVLTLAIYQLIIFDWLLFGLYIALFLCLPLLYFLFKIDKHHSQSHYARFSKFLKIIMILGIATLIVYYFLQQKHFTI